MYRRQLVKRFYSKTTTEISLKGSSEDRDINNNYIFEQQFQLPGIGRYMYTAIAKRDYPGIQAVALIYATFVVLVNLVIDLLYARLDPRIKYQ